MRVWLAISALIGCYDVAQQEAVDGIGDVDFFSLAADNSEVTVNAKWLQHLQVCDGFYSCYPPLYSIISVVYLMLF